jgi:hypothetical protein
MHRYGSTFQSFKFRHESNINISKFEFKVIVNSLKIKRVNFSLKYSITCIIIRKSW